MRPARVVLVVLLAGCGDTSLVSLASQRDAIVGGRDDSAAQYPASFYLRSDWNVGNPTACSATLISPRTLLTGAHCVDPRKMSGASSVTVFATNLSPRPDASQPGWTQVSDVVIHPAYDPSDYRDPNDLALVLLPEAPTGVTPIPANATDLSSDYVGKPILVVGWGNTSETASDRGTRRVVELTMRDITATSILIGDQSGKGICNGDSGGPSIHTFPEGARVVGVHSYTVPGAQCHDGADVRVDRFAAFINEYQRTREGLSCNRDGMCLATCAADPDCAPPGCGFDGVCVAGCASDEDCPCFGDGRCNGFCTNDPDCIVEPEPTMDAGVTTPPPPMGGGCASAPAGTCLAFAAALRLRRRRIEAS